MNTPQPEPRLFHLVRPSGTVAEGVEWSDGAVTLRWRGQWPVTSVWEGGVDAVLAVHGRNGAAVRWLAAPSGSAAPSGAAAPSSAAAPPAGTAVAPGSPAAGSGTAGGRPAEQRMDWQVVNGLRLAAPGVDGRCVSCGLVWPCLSCGP